MCKNKTLLLKATLASELPHRMTLRPTAKSIYWTTSLVSLNQARAKNNRMNSLKSAGISERFNPDSEEKPALGPSVRGEEH